MKPVLQASTFAFSLAVCGLSLAACGGGGGGGSTTPAVVTTPGSGSGTGSGTATPASAAVTIGLSLQQYAPVVTSSTARKAQFLSPATAQITLKLISVNGQAQTGPDQTFAVGPNATSCSAAGGIVSCSLAATMPVGNDIIAASTIDAGNNVLGTSQIAATIVQNATNRIPLAVGGSIAKIQLYLSRTSFVSGTPATANVLVVPFDSSGAAIVNPGNYSPAIAITATNSAGHFSFITNGAASGLASTINSPNDQVVLNYDGAGSSGTINMIASAGTGITDTASASYGAPNLSISPSGTQLVNAFESYIFTAAGQTGSITAGGGVPPYTIVSSNPAVVTTSGTSPNFTLTAAGYGSTGSATITIHDSAASPGTKTIPVTFIAPPVTLSTTTCGGTCNATGATWIVPLGGPVAPLSPTTVTATGGIGTYTYVFATTGNTTSNYVSMSATANTFTMTPNGFGNEGLIVTSGNQTAYYVINASANAFGQALPSSIGFLVEGVGKSYSATLPSFVTNVAQLTGATNNSFVFLAGGPSISASPVTPGTGKFSFSNATSAVQVPFTTFGLTFSTYQGPGFSQPTQTFNAPGADEALVGIGVSDTVTVSGLGGALSAASSNTSVVTTSVSTNHVTVTSTGAGFATITLKDAFTGATVTYPVSVTTATIPIASTARQ